MKGDLTAFQKAKLLQIAELGIEGWLGQIDIFLLDKGHITHQSRKQELLPKYARNRWRWLE
jgi:hypothetical protein